MKLKKLKGFIPDTANGADHASAVECRALIESIAKETGSSVTVFEVNNGEVIVGFSDDKAQKVVDDAFSGLDGVTISDITDVQFQFEKNRERQKKIDAARKTRTDKKPGQKAA